LELHIGDDGIGFEFKEEPVELSHHFGLKTMRERAVAIGADIRIESVPSRGTFVTVWLPIEEG